jgi:hypothetical protein
MNYLAVMNAKRDIIIKTINASPAHMAVKNVLMIIIKILLFAKNV